MKHTVDLERLKPFGIELAVDGDGEIDLHNFADFIGHTIGVDSLVLEWRSAEEGKLTICRSLPNKKFRHEVIKTVSWVFEGIADLHVRPRDPEMPLSEDETLNFFEIKREFPGVQSRFVFHGGVEIQFGARSTHAESA
jgi:hypothetical protein